MPVHRLVLIAACCWLLAGASCATKVVREAPRLETREVLVYVPIPAELTQPHGIAEGPLSQCPAVAAARREQLQKCNADKAQIATVQGTRAEPED